MENAFKQPQNRRLSRRKQVWLVGGIVLVIAIAIFIFFGLSDNKGVIESAPVKPTPAATPAFKQFDGKYIMFRYLGIYQAHTLAATDNDLELSMLSADTNYDKRLAVSVSHLDGGRLNTTSVYQLRQSQPAVYAASQIEVAGTPAMVWIKHDGSEETVLIPHGALVASLSFTTMGTNDNLKPEVAAVLNSFHWK